MKTVAVLGAGNSGKGLAGDAAVAGHKVRLWETEAFARNIEALKETKQIRVVGSQNNSKNFKRDGIGTLEKVTTDMKEAVSGADIIAVSVVSHGFDNLFEQLIPCLEDGQVITFYPDNYASLIMRKKMREMGCTKKVIIGGWSSLPYGARVTDNGPVNEVFFVYRAVSLRGDALPSSDREEFFKTMREFACMDPIDFLPGDTMLDVNFCNVNPILHVPAVLMNAGAIDNWGIIDPVGDKDEYYSIYRHGFSPSVAKVQYGIYLEEVEIAKAMGVGIQHYDKDVFFSRLSILGPEFMGDGFITPLEENMPDWYRMKYFPGARFTVQNRYVSEDVPIGTKLFYELGKKAGVKTPLLESMINIGCAVNDENYFETGWGLDKLGIDEIEMDDLLVYLREGKL